MTPTYAVTPVAGPLDATIRPPGSKSVTNRALVCAALARGESRLRGALASDDTRVMIEGLRAAGYQVEWTSDDDLTVVGGGGEVPATEAGVFVEGSGTTVRFLTALLTLGHGAFRLDGSPRMRERPIGELARALGQLGAAVQCESPGECPPVTVHANGLPGGEATLRGDVSSQYLSGLLMTAPCAAGPVELAIDGQLVSQPYVAMTIAVMKAFGAEVDVDESMRRFRIEPSGYYACDYAIEPDASAASYWWAAAAIAGGRVTVDGIGRGALQGDVHFVDRLEEMGCRVDGTPDAITVHGGQLTGITADMNAMSDVAQTLAAVALFAEGPTLITGVAHNRLKETDRIGNLAAELRKLGARVTESDSGLRIEPGPLHGAEIDTYDDHRMAMSLALVGLKVPGVVIRDPGCTSKTYPKFFADLERVTQR